MGGSVESGGYSSPLELFRDMFEMDGSSPLAALDRQLDNLKRQGSFFGSVFGLGQHEDPQKEPEEIGSQNAKRRDNDDVQASCTTSMREREKRIAFIKEEFRAGDLTEEEYKDLARLLTREASNHAL